MKRTLIIYVIMFVLTLAIPALVCFTPIGKSNTEELATIFRGMIIPLVCCH